MYFKLHWFSLFSVFASVTSLIAPAAPVLAHTNPEQQTIAPPPPTSSHLTSSHPLQLAQADPPRFEYENYDFWAEQCLTLAAQKQYEEALLSCEQAIVLKPRADNIDIWLARSQSLFQLGRYAESLVSNRQVIANSPRNSGAIAYQCAALFQLQQYGDAIDRCEQALQMDGNWGSVTPGFAWYYHGLALHAIGRLETAFASFSQAVQLNPEDRLAQAECLNLALELNAAESGVCNLPTEIAVNASDTTSDDSLSNLTPSEFSLDRSAASDSDAANLPADPPRSSDPATSTSSEAFDERIAQQARVLQQAVQVSEQALAVDPSRPEVWFQQGMALEQLGDYERALTAFDRALQLRPDRSLTLAHRCAVLNLLERYEPALESCNQAFQSDQRWGSLGVAYGLTQQSLALMGLGRLPESLAAIDQATALASPYAPMALTQRSNVLSAMGRYDEAIATAQAAIDQVQLLPEATEATATELDSPNPAQTTAPSPADQPPPTNQPDPGDAFALNSQAVSYWQRGGVANYEWAAQSIAQSLALYEQPLILPETFESRIYVEPLALRLRGQILAQFNEGRISSSLGDQNQAITSYSQALDRYERARQSGISPLSDGLLAELWLNLGVAYLNAEPDWTALNAEPDWAALCFEQAVNLAPDRFEPWYNWALALTRLQRYDQAARAYDQAEQLRPNSAAVQAGRLQMMIGRANSLAGQGQVQDAIALYNQVLTIDPTNQAAQQQLQQLVQASVSPRR